MRRYLLFSLSVLLFSACKQEPEQTNYRTTKETLQFFKQANEELAKNPDLTKRLAFWNKKLSDPKYSRDSVLRSKIHYNIAGVFYGMNQVDSLKSHMQQAWALMEGKQGYDDSKIQLYAGLGNAANAEQKIHQENYYYNQAAQMLNADTLSALSAKQKINIYFAAAQSCNQLKQFDQAFSLNRKAIALLPQLPDNDQVKFRAYSQMASCFANSRGNGDSVLVYIKKMDQLFHLKPDAAKARFVYDRKASYYVKISKSDSAIYYHQKKLAIDQQEEAESGEMATSVRTANLYTSYTGLAASFLLAKQTDSAEKYLVLCEKFEKKYPGKADEENFTIYRECLVDYLFATRQYAGAEQQQNLLIQEYKALYENENARAVEEMATIYQLLAKDKSIHHLNETVGLAQSNLQSNRLWLLVTTLAALLSISIILLLYYFQKQRKLKNETEKAQLEQRLLRTQMEPHFIFNTLSALQSFVRFDEKEKTLKYLNQFGRLLRSSLELSRESQVPLSEEIATLENYLSLQQMRYDDAFSYIINLSEEEDTESIYVPPMLIQPFVENAIMHGFDQEKRDGRITIDFDIKDALLLVKITDNGKGITADKADLKRKSLSTTISRERLAILAKESGLPAGIEIRSGLNEGTSVVLTIPMMTAHRA